MEHYTHPPTWMWLKRLAAAERYRPSYHHRPAVSILSPMEARLLQVDRMILGGMNAGVWPATEEAVWMSRPMQQSFGLRGDEKRFSLASHDAASFLCSPEVICTRAESGGKGASVASPWLLRLMVMQRALHGSAHPVSFALPPQYLEYAGIILRGSEAERQSIEESITPPLPTPALEDRPQRASVSAIGMLMQNPYAYYARYILGLRKLDRQDGDEKLQTEYGNFMHQVLEYYTTQAALSHGAEAFLQTEQFVQTVLQAASLPESTKALWRGMVERTLLDVTELDQIRRNESRIWAEQTGELHLTSPVAFTLHAKADRVEIRADGSVVLVDYKTGQPPAEKEMMTGLKPQMPLEGLIANQGGYSHLQTGLLTVAGLEHWHLKRDELKIESSKKVQPLIDAAQAGLEALLHTYLVAGQCYEAVPDVERDLRYDESLQLCRYDEWRYRIS